MYRQARVCALTQAVPSHDIVPLNDERSLDTLTLRDLWGSWVEVSNEQEDTWVSSSNERFRLESHRGVSMQEASKDTGEGKGPQGEVGNGRKETKGTLSGDDPSHSLLPVDGKCCLPHQ